MACLRKVMTSSCSKSLHLSSVILRTLSTSSVQQTNGSEGWFSKLLHVRKIDPGKDSHSRLLSDSDTVYELQIHSVKPDSVDPYLKGYENWTCTLQNKLSTSELVGSWRVEIGDQDQFIHIWRFNKGYPSATDAQELCNSDADLQQLHKERVSYLRSRENQFMLAFSFWGHPKSRDGKNMYEIRSYILKPGTMIEWGNNCSCIHDIIVCEDEQCVVVIDKFWQSHRKNEHPHEIKMTCNEYPQLFIEEASCTCTAGARGITYRKSSAVGGFFSQIGQLYMVHHIWSYKDLQLRKDVREDAWRKPGWDECVAYTVPLIREMRSRWLRPNHFSPLK